MHEGRAFLPLPPPLPSAPSHAVLHGVAVLHQATHIQAGDKGRDALSQLHLLLHLQQGSKVWQAGRV